MQPIEHDRGELVFDEPGATVLRVPMKHGVQWRVTEFHEEITADCRNRWRLELPSVAVQRGYAGSVDVPGGILTRYWEAR